MKNIILSVALLVIAFGTHAQTPSKTEGAHQSEYNAKQHEVDGETGPSKTLPDARSVSDSNESLPSDTSTTEENTMASAADSQAALDGTGNMSEATLNIAGSPVPGSPRKVTEKQTSGKPAVSPQPVRKTSSTDEKVKADVKSKKKRKR